MRGRLAAAGASLAALTSVGVLFGEAALARAGASSSAPEGDPDLTVAGLDGPPLMFAVLGDSTGVAVGASDLEYGYPRLIARALSAAARRPVSLSVLAVSGARVADVRSQQLPAVRRLRPDIVLIVVGGNDVTHGTGRDAARRDLRAVITSCAETGAAVVVAGVPAMGTAWRVAQPLRWVLGWWGRRLDAIWREETAAQSAVRVELAAETAPAFAADASLYSGDGFHPGDRGYALWAAALERGVLAAHRRSAGHVRTPPVVQP